MEIAGRESEKVSFAIVMGEALRVRMTTATLETKGHKRTKRFCFGALGCSSSVTSYIITGIDRVKGKQTFNSVLLLVQLTPN